MVLIERVPRENLYTLFRLAVFLNDVAAYSDENKMDKSNLATMFGPNILRRHQQNPTQILSVSIRRGWMSGKG